ncbi:hypothetical protein TPHA_0D00425 [Tetrapisispora phaffii CBS 4417]|uniref:Uncharacterized protein n=1 Tax=Tetrapisispora phaffii (strain ATCC 24235 / CBS 4417 / NBRC 1672 / NRRL Y-8282 / UCD 70-5) TaxID=1071381 RepID=G8BS65_TETPH|nr:hypothetical protein TPHA_0D00425 [Tetrapisispora phaffii CBS 4417]CCE62686.1 hypothetical protein TPHA_0D00425 [Tetrapisispora phaffii CBS 4417]
MESNNEMSSKKRSLTITPVRRKGLTSKHQGDVNGDNKKRSIPGFNLIEEHENVDWKKRWIIQNLELQRVTQLKTFLEIEKSIND